MDFGVTRGVGFAPFYNFDFGIGNCYSEVCLKIQRTSNYINTYVQFMYIEMFTLDIYIFIFM